ncbi:MAG: GtrA family protein [Candidatus Pacebacteria bacterium]|nr:GtrA family protein [Candidatus Paceibacterota bacterium]
MSKETKKDARISFLIGLGAGLLAIPIINNMKVNIAPYGGYTAVVIGMGIFCLAGYLFAYLISLRWPVVLQFVRFGIVGGFNTLFDLGILNLLIYLTDIDAGIYYSVFKAISFCIAVINSYIWNKFWTFKTAGEPVRAGEAIKFFAVYLVGFGINVSVASILVNFIGAPEGIDGKIWANIGALTASFTGLFWNFLGTKFIVFKK